MDKLDLENLNKWHLSKYALFTENPENNNEIFYVNTLFKKFCILTKKEFQLLFNFNNSIIEIKTLNKFIKEKIIVNFDELKFLEGKVKEDFYFTKGLSITICPTLNCNFDCLYCFEKHRSGKMSLETQDKVVFLIKNMIEKTESKHLRIHWFGGEPLLYPEIIKNLSKKLILLCEQNNVKYSASIITNGYLLTQKIADMLYNLKVDKYQITLDGIGKTHDYTRHLVNGQGTYDKIIENLNSIKIHGRIDIRFTLNEDNLKDSEKLEKIIEEIQQKNGNNFHFYKAMINYNENLKNRKEKIKLIPKKIIKDTDSIIGFNFPKTRLYCTAQKLSCITIDERGKLYKCRDDTRENCHFGDINTWNFNNPLESAENPDMIVNYINSLHGLDDKECRECVWMPFCGGGCVNQRFFYNKNCVLYKNNPDYFILNIAKYYLKKIY